jgi:UDP-2,3-diacylglucosamine hydrolase
MHGDTLCTDDHAYQKARKIAYNPLLQKVFLCLPLKLRRKIANRLRAKSAAHTQQAPKEIMDVTLTTVSQVLKKHDVRYLIHGHTHRPAVHLHYLDDGSKAERIVLGAWHDTGNALTWNETGHHELIQLGGIE